MKYYNIENDELKYQVSNISTSNISFPQESKQLIRRFCGLEKIFQMLMTWTIIAECNLPNPNTNQKYVSLMPIGVGIVKFNYNINKRIRILKKRNLKLIIKLENSEKNSSYNSFSNKSTLAFQQFSIYKRDVCSIKYYEWRAPDVMKW